MITAPFLPSDEFENLVAYVGGPRVAAKALGVSTDAVRQWLGRRNPPHWACRLLWFHTAGGRNAIAEDIVTELRLVAGERDALRMERDQKARLIDENRAALAARVRALESENDALRKLLQADALAEQLAMASAILDRLLANLRGAQPSPRAA
jgi:hypothetical protein